MAIWRALLTAGLLAVASANDVITSTGYQVCQTSSDMQIKRLGATFDRSSRVLAYDIDATSSKQQYVRARLTVTAFGQQVYQITVDPCSIGRLCPMPAMSFASNGTVDVPEAYANQIPDIAYTIPDLDGAIKLEILQKDADTVLGCIEASVTNGKTVQLPAVKYVGIGIAILALLSSALVTIMSAANGGSTSTISPSFTTVVTWFQSMAVNGMLSVDYPPVYRSWTSNFAFSTGLVTWPSLQYTIDNFRSSTGGNTTVDNYDNLRYKNHVSAPGQRLLTARDTTTFVNGFQNYAAQLTIPAANIYMTLLLIFAMVIVAMLILILLFKGILEVWNKAHPLPRVLESWRQRYWWRLTKAVTGLVIILYGVWTMYSIYQFTAGDSWAAKLLAGVSLGLFTALLVFFTTRIIYKARQLERQDGDVRQLYEDKETWIKYSLFYDSFKRTYWWIFIPLLIGAFARGAIVAGANGHGLVQTIGHILVDVVLLVLLLWARPYQTRSGNIINIVIQVVRVLSVAAVIVFVKEFGLSQTTKSVTGFAIIIVQAVLAVILAILLIVNAIIFCVRENPERRRRKNAEKYGHGFSDSHDDSAMLMHDVPRPMSRGYIPTINARDDRGGYGPVAMDGGSPYHSRTPSEASYHDRSHSRSLSQDRLIPNAAGMGHQRSDSRPQTPQYLSSNTAYNRV